MPDVSNGMGKARIPQARNDGGSAGEVSNIWSGALTVGICAALLATFAGVAWMAVRGKCATYDEPMHVASARAGVWQNDFRGTPDHPCLWEYWAALPLD